MHKIGVFLYGVLAYVCFFATNVARTEVA